MISVCMATYNGAKYIREQVSSILPQLGDGDELIVSDDGSTDDTLSVLKEFCDRRIKVFPNQTGRHGVVPNFENALRHAKGDYIFLSDQDDTWTNDKVKVVVGYLERFDFVSHNALITDVYGNSSNLDYFSLRRTKYGYLNNLWKMGYLGCCMAFRKQCLKKILPFPKNILWHDMWIAAMLHLCFKGVLVRECLINYRRHGDNASPTTEKSGYSNLFRLKYRAYIFVHSLRRYFY